MATFTDRKLVKQVITNGGFSGEDRAQSVYEYEAGGDRKKIWMAFWGSATDMLDQRNVFNPRLLWNKEGGLTPEGKEFMADDS